MQGEAGLPDDELLDLVQRQTFRYFWDFAHPVSGLPRDRGERDALTGSDTISTGGSGMGAMVLIVAVERGWITRRQAVERLLTMTDFLLRASSFHGVLPHFIHGSTGRTIPFSRKDDGSDIVETSYLIMGLLCARQYFADNDAKETLLRERIDELWQSVEWNWHTQGGQNMLFWHWSPNNGWTIGHEIRGWSECLITYVLAASSPRFPIHPDVYHHGWVEAQYFLSRRQYYGIELPLGPPFGGPLFFAHYSFMGLDPRGLKDRYADYWRQNVQHTLINYEHCVRNPLGFTGYGPHCWGLTSSESDFGYVDHSPTNDRGVISPSAALSSMPYTPEHSMRALRYFYEDLGERIWGQYGFADAFNLTLDWYAPVHLAIDQGPIVVMIENHRTGLLWKLFMSCPEIAVGLRRLGFDSPSLE